MKLLTKPTYTHEEIEIKIATRVETKLHPLGLLGIGPITTSKEIPERALVFPGRMVVSKVEIDFEDDDAIATCLHVGRYTFRGVQSKEEHWSKNKIALTFEGEGYILHGVIPLECLRDNAWSCNIDFFEKKRREYGIG